MVVDRLNYKLSRTLFLEDQNVSAEISDHEEERGSSCKVFLRSL